MYKSGCIESDCKCREAHRECGPTCHCSRFPSCIYPCSNCSMSRGQKHKLLIGISTVSGMGAFANQNVSKGEFLGEYVGEVITEEEAEERTDTYIQKGRSYMFDLAFGMVLDATNFGNALRFINHSEDNPNCYPSIKVVDGDLKIGFYALKNIKEKQELFFNYGPKFKISTNGQNDLIMDENLKNKFIYFDEEYIARING